MKCRGCNFDVARVIETLPGYTYPLCPPCFDKYVRCASCHHPVIAGHVHHWADCPDAKKAEAQP